MEPGTSAPLTGRRCEETLHPAVTRTSLPLLPTEAGHLLPQGGRSKGPTSSPEPSQKPANTEDQEGSQSQEQKRLSCKHLCLYHETEDLTLNESDNQ